MSRSFFDKVRAAFSSSLIEETDQVQAMVEAMADARPSRSDAAGVASYDPEVFSLFAARATLKRIVAAGGGFPDDDEIEKHAASSIEADQDGVDTPDPPSAWREAPCWTEIQQAVAAAKAAAINEAAFPAAIVEGLRVTAEAMSITRRAAAITAATMMVAANKTEEVRNEAAVKKAAPVVRRERLSREAKRALHAKPPRFLDMVAKIADKVGA